MTYLGLPVQVARKGGIISANECRRAKVLGATCLIISRELFVTLHREIKR